MGRQNLRGKAFYLGQHTLTLRIVPQRGGSGSIQDKPLAEQIKEPQAWPEFQVAESKQDKQWPMLQEGQFSVGLTLAVFAQRAHLFADIFSIFEHIFNSSFCLNKLFKRMFLLLCSDAAYCLRFPCYISWHWLLRKGRKAKIEISNWKRGKSLLSGIGKLTAVKCRDKAIRTDDIRQDT